MRTILIVLVLVLAGCGSTAAQPSAYARYYATNMAAVKKTPPALEKQVCIAWHLPGNEKFMTRSAGKHPVAAAEVRALKDVYDKACGKN